MNIDSIRDIYTQPKYINEVLYYTSEIPDKLNYITEKDQLQQCSTLNKKHPSDDAFHKFNNSTRFW